jgi:chorismate dehydratase
MIFRLGVVHYLNMAPLVHGLDGCGTEGLEVKAGPPSRLAQWLERGEIDAGMIPVAALFRHPEWRVMGRSMIGSRGPVRSVAVIGPDPPATWRRLRPDPQSVTSNALAQVALRRMGVSFELAGPIPENGWTPPPAPMPAEAFVAIGSRALAWRDLWREARPARCILDLGEWWTAWTGLPFVYAVWTVRPGVEVGDWPERLEALKRRNLARIDAVAREWPSRIAEGMTPADAEAYLTRNVSYDLDGSALAGLRRFYEEGRAVGLFTRPWEMALIG